MTQRLSVTFTPSDGAIVRMLGLVERRGYLIRGLEMRERAGDASLVLDTEERDLSGGQVLARQLRRLVDVRSVSLSTHRGSPQ